MKQDELTLNFDQIISQLQNQAVSPAAREALSHLTPSLMEGECRARMEETTAARRVLEQLGTPPLAIMEGLEEAITGAVQGAMLSPEQLCGVARFAASVRALRRYLENSAAISPAMASWRVELPALSELEDTIDRCVREDAVLDEASPTLRTLRRRREVLGQELREKLNRILARHKTYLADSYITQRAGRYVVPVQRRYQSSFEGTVVDASAKGGTVFMEPAGIVPLRQELDALEIDIDCEERRVLYQLSGEVADQEAALRRSSRAMVALDVLFARARYSVQLNARPVTLTATRRIVLKEARHPLLPPERCVPLSLTLEGEDCGIAITGPNTGGKTVALKTVGLMCLMAQCGLHLPCAEGTELGLCDGVYCDIGDSQSITQSLSTFSGHMTNVIRMLRLVSRDSLVLLDELGSGTDPAEGSGIAIAVLEELLRRGCRFLVTTHDPQVKQWAVDTPGVVPARMAFDRETLSPLYRLELGQAGESCALEIARRLGLHERLLRRAAEAAGVPVTLPAAPPMTVPATRLQRVRPAVQTVQRFSVGDSVTVQPEGIIGIVYRPEDEAGNVIVQVRGEKRTLRHTRLQLRVPASELYPPDYDFSIIFDTVANRKAAHDMARKFDPTRRIVHQEGTEGGDA